jgi:hypothetical protein
MSVGKIDQPARIAPTQGMWSKFFKKNSQLTLGGLKKPTRIRTPKCPQNEI